MSTKRICKKNSSYWHFGIKRGQKGQKRYFYRINHVYGFVIFYLILMIFFFIWFLFERACRSMLQIWHSSYRFRDKRDLKGPMPKIVTFIYCVEENYCIKHFRVSKLLNVSQFTWKYTCSNFRGRHAAVVSCCTLRSPLFSFWQNSLYMWMWEC